MKLCSVPACFLPVFGKGLCRNHQHLRTDKDYSTPLAQRSYQKAVAEKKKQLGGSIDDFIEEAKTIMDLWFADKIAQMTGRCANCGGKTTKGDKKHERFSIAHILPKARFDSVKIHPLNWIELCHFGNSCHANYDNGSLELTDMSCMELMIERYLQFQHLLTSEERARKEVTRFEKLKVLLKQ